MWNHWRGRYGLGEEQQRVVWGAVDASSEDNSALDGRKSSGKEVEKEKEKGSIRFKTYDGEIVDVTAEIGQNLVEVGRANDLPSLEGVCGGNLGTPFFGYSCRSTQGLISGACRMRNLSPLPPDRSARPSTGTG
jgi:hypothetical protein